MNQVADGARVGVEWADWLLVLLLDQEAEIFFLVSFWICNVAGSP